MTILTMSLIGGNETIDDFGGETEETVVPEPIDGIDIETD